jgi:predicted nucleic acid-binding Zn ribbon protein
MIYRYQAPNGAIAEHTQSMVQPIPESILRDGIVHTRIFDIPGVIYKCMGFYSTDNASSIEQWRRENLANDA